jgi:hypothetical protein
MKNLEFSELAKWMDFNNFVYSNKGPQDLRVLYLSGPDPENYIDTFFKNGLIIENIWALAANENTFYDAIESMAMVADDKLKL